MADTTSQQTRNEAEFTIDTGAPVPVSVDHVDLQLSRLWREVAESAQSRNGGQAITMAQVLNLIVRAHSYTATNAYIKDVEAITGRHPCRVIATTVDPAEGEMPVQAWVSIHCQTPPTGGRQVCCEQVTVAAGGEATRQVPAAVIPLLIPDLPVFLWWPQGTPFEDSFYRNLTDSINRLIVDSSTFENPEGTLSKMHSRLKSRWSTIACTDMNWGRLTRWRELVAQFFDGMALRPYLDRIEQVTIDFALSQRGGVNRAQALMVAGWLSSQLGWQPADPVYQLVRSDGAKPASARLFLNSGTRSITITLNPSPIMCEVPGDIRSVRLVVPGADPAGPPEALFEVILSDDQEECAWINTEIEGATPTKRNIQMETLTRADLLDGELEVFSHDKVYEGALDMVGIFIRGTASNKQPEGPRKIQTGEPISAGAQSPQGEHPQRSRPQGAPPQ